MRTWALTATAWRYQRIAPTQRGQISCSCIRDFDQDKIHSIQVVLSLYGLIILVSIRHDHHISLCNDFVVVFHEPNAVISHFQLQNWYRFYCRLFLTTAYTMWTTITSKWRYLHVKRQDSSTPVQRWKKTIPSVNLFIASQRTSTPSFQAIHCWFYHLSIMVGTTLVQW